MTEAEARARIPLWKKEFESKYGTLVTSRGESDQSYGIDTRWVGHLDQFGHIIPHKLEDIIKDLEEWIEKEYIKK